jgi:hypothetical protein
MKLSPAEVDLIDRALLAREDMLRARLPWTA